MEHTEQVDMLSTVKWFKSCSTSKVIAEWRAFLSHSNLTNLIHSVILFCRCMWYMVSNRVQFLYEWTRWY